MDKVTGQCPQTTTFLKRKESRSGIEPRSFRLPAERLTAKPNLLTVNSDVWDCGFIAVKTVWRPVPWIYTPKHVAIIRVHRQLSNGVNYCHPQQQSKRGPGLFLLKLWMWICNYCWNRFQGVLVEKSQYSKRQGASYKSDARLYSTPSYVELIPSKYIYTSNYFASTCTELRSCVKVEVTVLGSLSLISLMVSVKQYWNGKKEKA